MHGILISRCNEDRLHALFPRLRKTPYNTGNISARILPQPPNQAVLGFRTADVTSAAVVGNGDNSRESEYKLGAWD